MPRSPAISRKGETIWTEACHKFHAEEIVEWAADAGFDCDAQWTDAGVAVRRKPAAGRMSAIVEFREGHVPDRRQGNYSRSLTSRSKPGETIVLLGRSGSGKTTALKMVNGLLLPTAGEVLVDGKPTTAWDPVGLRRRIGYVIQDVGLFPHFTVERNVGLVPRLEGWDEPKIHARVEELLRRWVWIRHSIAGSLSAAAFRRPAAARGRGAGTGGRSVHPAFR